MPQLSQQILNELKAKPNQLARDIAAKLGVDKKQVNSRFYGRLKGQVEQSRGYRWSLSGTGKNSAPVNDAAVYQKTDIARLSRYYLACMGQDAVGVSTFAKSRYEPDYVELGQLPQQTESLLAEPGCQRLLGKVRKERGRWAMYLGYPTSLKLLKSRKSNWQGYMVEPVFLFAVEMEGPNKQPVLDLSYPIINQKVLQAYTHMEREALMEELALLESELGIGDSEQLPELDELAMRLQAIRSDWPWQEAIEPDSLSNLTPLENIECEGIFNRAVMVMAERSPFTQGLEGELRQLAQLPAGATDGTALGAWLSGSVVTPEAQVGNEPLVEVLPMNLEQYAAVESALNKPLSIITGPPGTGKSQVVTNLLVNAAWQGKRVLFASKNNKAVDVVEARVNNLGARPLLLRVGAGPYQTRLAEYLMSLMSATATRDDQLSFDEALDIHKKLQDQLRHFNDKTNDLMTLRNQVDQLEQLAEQAREELPSSVLETLKELDFDDLIHRLTGFSQALNQADKQQQGFFTKLFWGLSKKERFHALNQRIGGIANSLETLDVNAPDTFADELNHNRWVRYLELAEQRVQLTDDLKKYLDCLSKLQNHVSLEHLSLKKFEVLTQVASNSEKLWGYWLKLQPARLTQQDRQMLNRYTALLKMVLETGPEGKLSAKVYREYHSLFPKVSHLLSCWAVTSLSAKGKLPFEAGFFDLVVFDEASQCDIASALPLLYRAKAAAVIGDPKQLAHISGLQRGQDQQLLDRFDLISDFPHWSYSVNSLFDLAAGLVSGDDVVSLLDHHRSHADVIEFSNQEFYEGRLRVATRYDALKRPLKDAPGVMWAHVEGQVHRPAAGGAINQAEVEKIVSQLELLVLKRGYLGSIGVVSPFRAQANAVRQAVEKNAQLSAALLERDFLVDTVHRFQGDERDVMFFSPVVSQGMTSGALGFLRSNGNLFNVAITRARAQLLVVGDHIACSRCDVDYLANFAVYTQQLQKQQQVSPSEQVSDNGPIYPSVSNPEQVSDWERILYEALYKAGIRTLPQYRVEKYILDLALFDGERRLDIEVDGERYHRNWTGELCRRDQIRNQRLFELDWDVKAILGV